MENEPKKKFIAKSIFMTHVRRIGWARTALGGGLMYVSVAEFIFLHLTTIVVLYRWLLAPAFGLKRFRIRDYLLLDRSGIAGMRAFDKLNCEFCGYANGTAKLWNDQLDEMARAEFRVGKPLAAAAAALYAVCLAIFLGCIYVFSKLLFLAISLFLGMHRADTAAIGRKLRESGYADGHGTAARGLIRSAKLYAESLAVNLEQIESGWCPLKHAETGTEVVPDHHANFYERNRLAEAIEALERDGSVSPRKPKY